MSLFHKKNQRLRPREPSSLQSIGSDPFVDWVVIICISVCLGIVLIGVGVFSYYSTISRLSNYTPGSSVAQAPGFDEKLLESVHEGFKLRASERAALLKVYSGPGDPSL